MDKLMGADLLVECLIRENVRFVFGVPGSPVTRAVASGKPAVLDVVIDQWANLTPPDLENLDAVWMEGCELPW